MRKKALINYKNSRKSIEVISEARRFELLFDSFREVIQTEIDENANKYTVNHIVYISYVLKVDNEVFRYKGDNCNNSERMNFEDIQKLYFAKITKRTQIENLDNISGLAKQHPTYFLLILKKFQEFIKDRSIKNTVPR